jgi:NTE family protein
MNSELKIGLALGSGAARGMSHIGIINALAEIEIEPKIICGTSVGSLVGAAYAAGRLNKLESWARSLTRLDVARFIDINTSFTGFVDTDRLHDFLNEHVASDDAVIEDLPKAYASVATDLANGREVWLNEGSVIQSVWASMSLPGLFPAIKHNNSWLVDGGLVNPVPVSACRAMGADIVIAVNLNGDIVGKHFGRSNGSSKQSKASEKGKTGNEKAGNGFSDKLNDLVKEYTNITLFEDEPEVEQPPSLLDAIAGSVNICQDRITRSRMAGDPPDIMLSPKLSDLGLLELYRSDEAIKEGMKCVERLRSEIDYVLERA